MFLSQIWLRVMFHAWLGGSKNQFLESQVMKITYLWEIFISHKWLTGKKSPLFQIIMNQFGESHVFKPNMVKNNEQATVHEFKIFDIFQSVKKYEFLRSHYTMILVLQNLFWICGSHQTLTLME